MAKTSKRIKPSGKSEEEVVAFATNLIEFAKTGRKNDEVLGVYKKFLRYLDGEHKIKERSSRLGNQVYNKFAEIVDNRIAHIVSKRPKWKFMPQAEDDLLSADALNQLLSDVIWDMIEWDDKGEDSVLEAAAAGSSHVKTVITGDGFPDFVVVPYNSVLTDPKATGVRNRRFIIHLIPKDIAEIKKIYGKDVAPESELENTLKENDYSETSQSWQSSGGNTMPNIWARYGLGNGYDQSKWMQDIIGRALIYEIWCEDKSLEAIPFDVSEVEEEHNQFRLFQVPEPHPEENHPKHILAHQEYLATLNPETDSAQLKIIMDHLSLHAIYPLEEKRRKYPRGRIISVCQGQLLRDEPANPDINLDWQDMWTKWDWTKRPGKYWGKSLGHDLFDRQDAYNHRKNSITQNINMLNNGIKKLAVQAYNNLKGNVSIFRNLIGQVIPVRQKDDLTVDFGPPLPPQFFQDLYFEESGMEKQTGNEDVMAGRYPSGSPPGVTVNQLLGEGMKRVNLVVKHYAFMLQQMARNAMIIMSSPVFPKDKIFRILGNDNKYKLMEWGKIQEHLGKFDIRVDIDSMLSTSRQEKLSETIQLYQAGIYDRKAALNKLDDPDKYEIMQRIDEIMMLQQQNQMLTAENNEVKKTMNTMQNRLQTQAGGGNVGKYATG